MSDACTPTVGPLDGLLVVSCEQAIAGPLATRHLADLGARVLKIERPPTGDFAHAYDATVHGMSSHFVWLNRSKESVSLDLKQPAARDIMLRLVDRADVFVQNLAPGAVERLGLDPVDLRARNPRLVTCSISGYGSSGPYRAAKAYDLLIQSETGVLSITGTELSPAKCGIPVADIGAGMYAFANVLTALYQRERSGVGSAVEVSLFDSLIEWMGYPMYYTWGSGDRPARTGTSHAAIVPYGAYAVGDGSEVVLAVQNEREWVRFASEVMGRPTLATDPRFNSVSNRVANRTALDAEIDAVFRGLTSDQLVGRLEAASVANASQRDVRDMWVHPQLVERDRVRCVESPVGLVPALTPPVLAPGAEPRMDPVPSLGQHTEAVLRSLEYEPAEIEQLLASGAAVGGAERYEST